MGYNITRHRNITETIAKGEQEVKGWTLDWQAGVETHIEPFNTSSATRIKETHGIVRVHHHQRSIAHTQHDLLIA